MHRIDPCPRPRTRHTHTTNPPPPHHHPRPSFPALPPLQMANRRVHVTKGLEARDDGGDAPSSSNDRGGGPGKVSRGDRVRRGQRERLKEKFFTMIDDYRRENVRSLDGPSRPTQQHGVLVCLRKRPLNEKETALNLIDVVTPLSSTDVVVHKCKLLIDGVTCSLESNRFTFDRVFSDTSSTTDVYGFSVQPLVQDLFNGGRGMVFAFGQTGSGKTYTMNGLQALASSEIFTRLDEMNGQGGNPPCAIYLSCFELYGDNVLDLLNQRNKVITREGAVVWAGDTKHAKHAHTRTHANTQEGGEDIVGWVAVLGHCGSVVRRIGSPDGSVCR